MRPPRGFGKNYFRFAAILAYSVHVKLQATCLRYAFFLQHTILQESDEVFNEDPPSQQVLFTSCYIIKPQRSHCNCFFAHRTKLAVALFHYIPRCPYYNTYFAFRRSGVHPPYLF
ncbi:MAG: hypothetical protein IBX44_00370 [Sulfurospirillum sp.]|nr:hypothetical protein [Sulfurospirillum sp.]